MSQATCIDCAQAHVTVVASRPVPAFASQNARAAASEATALYDRGWFCGEAVLKVVNARAPRPLPDSVVRLGSGFCEGMGGAGCTCGALAGAVMAIGLLRGREEATEEWEPSFDASRELHDWFHESFRASCCRTIVRPFGGMEGEGRHEHCAAITGATAGRVVELAESHGWL